MKKHVNIVSLIAARNNHVLMHNRSGVLHLPHGSLDSGESYVGCLSRVSREWVNFHLETEPRFWRSFQCVDPDKVVDYRVHVGEVADCPENAGVREDTDLIWWNVDFHATNIAPLSLIALSRLYIGLKQSATSKARGA